MANRAARVGAVLMCVLLGTTGCGDDGGGDPDAGRVDAGGADAAPEPTCTDGTQNGDETDVDCGGGCAPCDDGATCTDGDDCVSARCVGGTCAPALLETGTTCTADDECVSGSCAAFGDTSICTEPCTTTCPGEMLACFDGTCTPRDYCENADGFGDGPGCTGTVCDACDATATCVELSGGDFECMCNTGYTGDGRTCADDDECTLGTDTCADANATCTNTAGSFTCECDAGYAGDGMTCADADECALGTDTCPDGAICTNTEGSFTCACGPGYVGDGTTCTDVDECADATDTCHADATCTNIPGAYECRCNPGFSGDGMTCFVAVESYVAWIGDTRIDGDIDVVVAGLPGAPFTTPTVVNPITTFGNAATSASFTQFSPDGTKIAFRGDFVTDGVSELFVVDLSVAPITAHVVNGPLVSAGNVVDFRWSPDSTRIVYSADQNTDGVTELFVVNVSGAVPGPSLQVSGPMVSGGYVQSGDFDWSPDGTRIAYQADQLVDNDLELFIVLVAGPTPDVSQRVNATLPAGADVEDRWAWAPDGSYIVYQADQDTLNVLEAYMVDLTGAVPGAPVKLNGAMVSGGNVGTGATDIAVSFDGRFVSYVADQTIDTDEQVFVVDVSGATPSAPVVVSDAGLTTNGFVAWSPTASRLVYTGDAAGRNEAYFVDLTAAVPTPAVRMHPALQPSGIVAAGDAGVKWSPDGRFVAIRADANVDNAFEVDVIDVSSGTPSAPIDASPPASTGHAMYDFEFAPDSSAIAVRGENVSESDEVFVTTLTGTPGTPVSVTGTPVGAASDVEWSRDPRYLLVEGDIDVAGVRSAYLIDLTAIVIPPVPLNVGTPSGGNVSTIIR